MHIHQRIVGLVCRAVDGVHVPTVRRSPPIRQRPLTSPTESCRSIDVHEGFAHTGRLARKRRDRKGKGTADIAEIEIGAVIDGTVERITPYGAFLKVEDGRLGLVHISEIDRNYVKDVHEHLREGDVVQA